MDAQPHWLACRALIAVEPGGRETTLTLRVGHPVEVAPGVWACACALDGHLGRLAPVHGIDAWQAIQLAFCLQHQLLGHLAHNGTVFLHCGSREPLALTDLFRSSVVR